MERFIGECDVNCCDIETQRETYRVYESFKKDEITVCLIGKRNYFKKPKFTFVVYVTNHKDADKPKRVKLVKVHTKKHAEDIFYVFTADNQMEL